MFAVLAFVLGAVLGWYAAECWWQWQHRGIHFWPPERGLGYYLLASGWALSAGGTGVALAEWRRLTGSTSGVPSNSGR